MLDIITVGCAVKLQGDLEEVRKTTGLESPHNHADAEAPVTNSPIVSSIETATSAIETGFTNVVGAFFPSYDMFSGVEEVSSSSSAAPEQTQKAKK